MLRIYALTLAALTVLTGCPDQGVTKFNATPEAAILSHTDGDEVLEAYEVTFSGSASDPDNAADTLKVTWYSGETVICEQTNAAADGLTSCIHTITTEDTTIRLEVSDPDAAAASAKVDLVVAPTDSPEVVITTPEASGVYYSDALITFTGVVTDTEDGNETLTAYWESNLDGELTEVKAEPNADGEVEGFGYLTEGEHAVQLHAADSTGKTGTASVIIKVGPPNTAPTCAITAPADNSASSSGELVQFKGTAEDVDVDPDWLAVEWSSDKDGVIGSSTPASDGNIAFNYSGLSVETHVITMAVSDEVGATCTTFITHTVGTPPTLTIDAPGSGDVINDGDLATFQATVNDDQDPSPDIDMQWDSSLDGVFSTQRADSTGKAEFTYRTLSIGTHTLTVTATDPDGLFTTALVTFTINGLPTAPVIALSPDPADTLDDLNVAIDAASVDPEGDTITYSYAWTKNGVASAASTSANLPKSATAKGEKWEVTVTPNDGYGDGDASTASLTIENIAPVLASVSLTPTIATVDSTMKCTPGTATDDDTADTVGFKYAWTVDGSPVSGATTDTLTSVDFAKNQSVYCTVTPNDGEDDGLPVDSNTVLIDNSIPEVSGLSITPDPAYASNTLTCAWTTFTDSDAADTDQSTVEWTKGGTSMGTSATLTGGFVDGDVLTCTVTPDDGEDTGTPVDVTIEIDNTAPELDSVSLTPGSPTEGSTLNCTPGTSDDDDGDTVTFETAWTVAGSGIAATTSSLTGADFDKGDSVTCTVTPKDGKTSGTPVTSNSVTIGNTKPVISSVTLAPTTAYTKSKLKATVAASDDDAADSLGYTYTWYSGTTKLAASGSELDGLTWFEKGEVISVQVVANDGVEDSAPFTSGSITISNTTPNVSGVSITPAPAYAGNTLTCAWTTFLDADSADTDQSTVVWKRGGATLGTGKTLTGGFKGGDNISCTVTAYDGEDTGPSVTANLVITNSVPVLRSVSLTPTAATEKSTLTCTPGTATDADGDTIGYNFAWTVSGTPISKTSHTLIGDYFSKGDTVMCTVTPRDGKGPGLPVDSNTVTIGNTKPVISSVTLSPTTAYTNTKLKATVAASDDDAADSLGYTYTWYSGTTKLAASGSELDGLTWFEKGESISVSVVANDGTDDSAAVSSAPVDILNSKPTAPVISIDPAAPEAGTDDLLCQVDTVSTDADSGDTVTYSMSWKVGASPYTGTPVTTYNTDDTIDGTATADAEVWECMATPHDGEEAGATATASVTVEGCEYGTGSSCPGKTCLDILNTVPSSTDGLYWIDPDGAGEFEAYCLMDATYDGGGWTLAAVSSDDGTDTWTWNNRTYMTTDTTTFGSLTSLNKDFKSPALHRSDATDMLFIHEPSGIWASYDNVGDGAESYADVVSGTPATCYSNSDVGYTQSAGTLTKTGKLCNTGLFFNALDRDGNSHCSPSAPNHTWGPSWSMDNNSSCPHDDPSEASIGPIQNASYLNSERPARGFGNPLNKNTGTAGTGANYFQVLVREGCKLGSASTCPAESCKEILDEGDSDGDGNYWLDPDGTGTTYSPTEYVCDMTTDSGGWTRVVYWDRETDGDTIADFESIMSKRYNNMTTWMNATGHIKWCDYNLSGDALAYEYDVEIYNQGESRTTIKNKGENGMGGSGTWLYATTGSTEHDILCSDNLSAHTTYYSATELSYVPGYTCGSSLLNWTWNTTEQDDFGVNIDTLQLTSLHSDGPGVCGDISRLYKLIFWVR